MSLDPIEYGVASTPIPGETESGDMHLVAPFKGGVLVGVLDGLGHGQLAAEAARAAVGVLARRSGDSVISLVQQCHDRLRKTRGVVMSIASIHFTDDTISWLGVGNVEGVILHKNRPRNLTIEPLLVVRGAVGVRLPPLQAAVLPIVPGDTLILVTDGIRRGFEWGLTLLASPQRIADHILERDGLKTDDALVLVVKYKGN